MLLLSLLHLLLLLLWLLLPDVLIEVLQPPSAPAREDVVDEVGKLDSINLAEEQRVVAKNPVVVQLEQHEFAAHRRSSMRFEWVHCSSTPSSRCQVLERPDGERRAVHHMHNSELARRYYSLLA